MGVSTVLIFEINSSNSGIGILILKRKILDWFLIF